MLPMSSYECYPCLRPLHEDLTLLEMTGERNFYEFCCGLNRSSRETSEGFFPHGSLIDVALVALLLAESGEPVLSFFGILATVFLSNIHERLVYVFGHA